MKAFLLLRKFNSKSGSFTKLRKEAKESRGLKPFYSHVELLVDDGTFYKSGDCSIMGYGSRKQILEDWEEESEHHEVVSFELPIDPKLLKERFFDLSGLRQLKGWEAVYFAEEGECIASKELRAFSCGPLVAYLLGYEDYYKVDSDELVDRVVNILVHYK